MFIGFANFYQRFIQGFSKIAILYTFILKITRLFYLALKTFRADNDKIVEAGDSKTNETIVNLSNKSKNKQFENQTYIKAIKKSICLTFNVKKIFNYLKQAFIKAPILWHFDLKSHI